MNSGSLFTTCSTFLRQLLDRTPRSRIIAAGVCSLIVLISVAAIVTAFSIGTAKGSGKRHAVISFPAGTSLRRLAEELERKQIIGSPRIFVAYARLKGLDSRVQAGTYLFTDGMTGRDVLGKLVAGDVYILPFAVPEGYSIFQIATLLEQRGYCRSDAFLRKCSDAAFLREIGLPEKSVEGYLYPGTYNLVGLKGEEAIIKEMVSRFDRSHRGRFEKRISGSGMTWREILTLASMIEKEAVVPAERPLISSVFHNRLKKGMRLQSDPTAVYGVRAFAGKVTKTDILRPSPYNTYTIAKLPPGPIGNPGTDAIEAALNPAATNYLYFVAKNDGSHHFSSTLEEHNRAVQAYLRNGASATQPRPTRSGN